MAMPSAPGMLVATVSIFSIVNIFPDLLKIGILTYEKDVALTESRLQQKGSEIYGEIHRGTHRLVCLANHSSVLGELIQCRTKLGVTGSVMSRLA